ncbi:MAG: family 16 glycosylhydrolase [Cyclobacteriaceae bacterium]|nr:family 16 glycosylhydrolase [Cyclobacteriaceae bacterium]
MKNFLLVLFAVSAVGEGLAQPVLPLDFESTTINYTFTDFLGGAATKIPNPQINGINTSATVAKMVKNPGEVFAGSFITLASPVNFATNKIIKVKVFSPVAGKKLLLKFEGAGPTFEKESAGITTANVWEELTFDFTGVPGLNNVNTRLVFIFDLGTMGDGTSNSTYLFDDVVQTSNYVGPVTGDYNLVWSDEFEGTGAPEDDYWFRQTQVPTPTGWFGGELQHYTNRDVNSFVANGYLNIVAKKENFTDQGLTKQYTSTRLNSKYAFKYGRVDVRAKMPSGAGTFPAIWMLGKNINEPGAYFASEFGTTTWPATGEIDIMEHWGNNPNIVHQSIHTPSSFGATVNTNTTAISQVSTTFHVYSIIWDANQIQFLIDDVAYYTYKPAVKNASTWPFDAPQYLLLNIAMGGGGGAVDPAFTQSAMEVDYVRVYQKGRIANTITFPAIPAKTLGAPAFALTATASSGLPVSYATTSDKISISGATVTLVKAGRVSIRATQDGNDLYAGAALAQQSFCVNPAKPTITASGMDTETVLTSSASAGNQWFFNGAPISGAVNATLAASAAGVYTVRVTVDDCVSEFSSETSVIVTGDLHDSGNLVDVYPNPVENSLEIRGLPGEITGARLHDLTGRDQKLAFESSGMIQHANLQHLAQGIYLLHIQAGNMTYRFKVIKK